MPLGSFSKGSGDTWKRVLTIPVFSCGFSRNCKIDLLHRSERSKQPLCDCLDHFCSCPRAASSSWAQFARQKYIHPQSCSHAAAAGRAALGADRCSAKYILVCSQGKPTRAQKPQKNNAVLAPRELRPSVVRGHNPRRLLDTCGLHGSV